MKRMVTPLIVILCSVLSVAQRKIAEDDPQWRKQTVRRAFSEVSAGMRSSWSEKYLARLGDSAAPEIMEYLASRKPTKKDAETALSLLKMAFANPRLIRRSPSRIPKNSFVLLDSLDKRMTDADTKLKIKSTREQLQSLSSEPESKKKQLNDERGRAGPPSSSGNSGR